MKGGFPVGGESSLLLEHALACAKAHPGLRAGGRVLAAMSGGIFTANGLSVKLQPIPRMTSAAPRKRTTPRDMETPAEPSESGWVSGKPPTPMSVVVTGMSAASANFFNSADAPLEMMPPPA